VATYFDLTRSSSFYIIIIICRIKQYFQSNHKESFYITVNQISIPILSAWYYRGCPVNCPWCLEW